MTTSVGPTRTGWIADDSTFGARLALVRQRMAWNVKEAADACGLPVESWRRWERDGRAPRDVLDVAGKIADRVGCDFGWLLGGQRLVTVNRPTGHTDGDATTGRATSEQNSGMTIRSTRTAYPNRVRPGEHRPVGHSATTTGPPTHRRPARRPRDV